MNRKLIHLTILTILVLPVYSQQENFNQNNANTVAVFDANGKPFVNPGSDIAGSPFFNERWNYGTVTLKSNAIYKKNALRLNVLTQEVHYMAETNVEMSVGTGNIKELVLTDSVLGNVTHYRFQNGFPAIDNQDEKFLYQVLAKGHLTLLMAVQKRVITEKNDFSGETQREYRSYEQLYICAGGAMQRFKKDKAFILGFMTGQQEKINAYTKTARPDYHSMEDIKKIIEYYNSLVLP